MKKIVYILIICLATVISVTACTVQTENIQSILNSSSGKRSLQFASDVLEDILKSDSKSTVKSNKSKSSISTSTSKQKSSIVKSSSELSLPKSNSSKLDSSESFLANSATADEPSAVMIYDAFVDQEVSSDGTVVNGVKTYKTVKSALSAIGPSTGKIIGIKSGIYQEKLTIPENMKNLTFVGESSDNTILTYGDCSSKAGGTDQSASITVLAEGFSAKNIHFENSYDYLKGTDSAKQALAMLINADRGTFYNCYFSGHQDTLEVVNGRHYFYDCKISGSVDFIFGNNPSIVFESCEIVSRNRNSSNGGYITAMKGNDGINGSGVVKYGLVFNNCNFTAENGVKASSVSLGRPWRANATVTIMNSQIGEHVSKKAYSGKSSGERYVYMNGGTDLSGNKIKNEPQNAYFTEYNNTGSGAITSAVKGCSMLSDSDAKNYTLENIFAKTNGMVTYATDFDGAKSLCALISLN